MRGDRIFGLVMIVVALGYILSATTIRSSFMSDPVGPRIFPYIIAAATLLCAVVMVLRPDPDVEWPRGRALANLGLSLAVLVAYTFTIKPLGFVIPTAIASGIISYQISPRIRPAILTGLCLGFGLQTMFKSALGLNLIAIRPDVAPYVPVIQPIVDALDYVVQFIIWVIALVYGFVAIQLPFILQHLPSMTGN